MDSTSDKAGQAPDQAGQASDRAGQASGEAGQADASALTQSPGLAKWLLIYTLLRVGMLVVLAGILALLMPLILALLFAVVLALPLSWLLFGTARRHVNEAMAISSAQRRGERERLRAALDGQDPRS